MSKWPYVVGLALGVGGGIAVLYGLRSRGDRRDLIDRFAEVGRRANYENERIPISLLREAVETGNAWMLGLWIATANWGVDWEGTTPPPDPAGRDWRGVGVGSGKHQLDGTTRRPRGGLGLPHWDSDHLVAAMEHFDAPLTPGRLYDDYVDSSDREVFLAWGDALVPTSDFQRWSTERWKSEKWSPGRRASGDDRTAIVNARIRNSLSGTGRRVERMPIEQQLAAYDDGGSRRARQIRYIRRALGLYDAIQAQRGMSGYLLM